MLLGGQLLRKGKIVISSGYEEDQPPQTPVLSQDTVYEVTDVKYKELMELILHRSLLHDTARRATRDASPHRQARADIPFPLSPAQPRQGGTVAVASSRSSCRRLPAA